jgi:hypothetical protein
MTLTALITALQQGDYDTVLAGTHYEGAKYVQERIPIPHGGWHVVSNPAQLQLEADAKELAAKVIVLEQAVKELREALDRSHDDMAGWQGYAGNYFLEKHGADDDLSNIKSILAATEGLGE